MAELLLICAVVAGILSGHPLRHLWHLVREATRHRTGL